MFTESPFDQFEVVIGLESHVQLSTNSKLFSPAKNRYGDEPNQNVDVIDAGLPGVLPVLNKRAVEYAVRLGLALSCQINQTSVFARKHYFYPDLPKGYQISQHDRPICEHGSLVYEEGGEVKSLDIERIHIEEDAGKSIHIESGSSSFVDYNRAGTPLLEVVTRPGLRSAKEAMAAITGLRTLVVYLGICDGNMQEGSLRFDVNVSVRRKGSNELGTRTETKNLNSVRYVGQAIEFEARRQILDLLDGKSIVQETRLWDPNKKESRALRSKEDAHDYRYFPDPDLLPLNINSKQIDEIQKALPELSKEKKDRFCDQLGLSSYDANILVTDKALADFFEDTVRIHNNPKSIANWIINDVLRVMKLAEDDEFIGFSFEACPIPSDSLACLVKAIDEKVISGKIAKLLFEEMVKGEEKDPLKLAQKLNLSVERDPSILRALIKEVLQNHPQEVSKYKAGRHQLFGFFIGQAMRLSKGQADPEELNLLLKEALDSEVS